MEVDQVDGNGRNDQDEMEHLKVVHVEVALRKESKVDKKEVKESVLDWLANMQEFTPGVVEGACQASSLKEFVQQVSIDTDQLYPAWKVKLDVHVYKLNDQGPYDESTEEDPTSTVFTHWELPAKQFDGMWENLLFESEIKEHLLEFATSSLLFSAQHVNPNVISWNHVVLLYGPPGTGKTSLCQALAQKLSVRLDASFSRTELLEINSHSLFSKWFSESGKLVSKLFSYVHELAEDKDTLVCILIDEVESLAAARSAAVSGSEPSDSIRVVNALLTQLDRLKTRKNVIVLTTSNITEAIDVAFVDRADIRQYIGLPNFQVRALILKGCIEELTMSGIISAESSSPLKQEELILLEECASLTDGLSGRALRKLPFQAHARYVRQPTVSRRGFLKALVKCAKKEHESAKCLEK